MDPVTIVIACVGIVLSLIELWDQLFGKKRDAWDVMSPDQKNYLIRQAASEAYTQRALSSSLPDQYPQRIANYFWTFISKYEVQDNFEEWLKKNKGMPELIKGWDEKYGRGFYQDPKDWKVPAYINGTANNTAGTLNNTGPTTTTINPLANNSKAGISTALGLGVLGAGLFAIIKNLKN